MALSATNRLEKGVRSYRAKNLGLVIADITLGSTGDYSSGIALDGAALRAALGARTLVHLFEAEVRTSAGVSRLLIPVYDPIAKALRLYKNSGTVSTPLTEITPGTDLAAGDIVRVSLWVT